jgi:hydroxymethylglutaryl-CoA lyase
VPGVEPAIDIRDVGPRDGLQGLAPLPPAARAQLANDLAAAGLGDVEAVSFVSPKAVPAMAGAAEVAAALARAHGTTWWALVPNRRGGELAIDAGFDHLTVTLSASPVYSQKNVAMTVAESLAQIESIRSIDGSLVLDAVVSCAFGSSFGDRVTVDDVASVCRSLGEIGVDRVTLADTTGTATPARIGAVLARTGPDVGLHLHDTRGTALANAYAAMQLGVRRFDTAVGGLGGSPFAPEAGGNLATEDLVLLLSDVDPADGGTGIDLDALLAVSARLADLLGRPMPSRVSRAGALPPW